MGSRPDTAGRPGIRVTILTEAGPAWGLGHLIRCGALRDGLEALGASVDLVVRGDASLSVLESGSRAGEWASPDAVATYLEGSDAAIVDSYHADAATYEAISARVRVCVFIDDHSRITYPSGIIVNSSPAADPADYPGVEPHDLLLGPRYHPMRRAFWDIAAREAIAPTLTRVLAVFGGTDASGLRATLLPELIRSHDDIEWDVVEAPRSAEQMRDAMLAADAAVSAAGQTLYELARTGTPTIAIVVAENQTRQARAFRDAGTLELAQSADADSLAGALTTLGSPETRGRMSRAAAGLVDGAGSLRTARAIASRVLQRRIGLVAARPEDEGVVLALANDPTVRVNSGTRAPISPEEHHAWFQRRLADPSSPLLLAWDGEVLAGQVRFDVVGSEATVGISIAEGYRGLGWGSALLGDAVDTFVRSRPPVTTLIARVRVDNEPSRRLFEGAGFVCDNPQAEMTPGFVHYMRPLSGL